MGLRVDVGSVLLLTDCSGSFVFCGWCGCGYVVGVWFWFGRCLIVAFISFFYLYVCWLFGAIGVMVWALFGCA